MVRRSVLTDEVAAVRSPKQVPPKKNSARTAASFSDPHWLRRFRPADNACNSRTSLIYYRNQRFCLNRGCDHAQNLRPAKPTRPRGSLEAVAAELGPAVESEVGGAPLPARRFLPVVGRVAGSPQERVRVDPGSA